ncbi:MAG: glycosyltransferase family A protein [Desulfoplanes sp.]
MFKKIDKKRPELQTIRQFRSRIHTYIKNKYKIQKLKQGQAHTFTGNPASNLLVSLTSFPARIDNVWATIETIFQQDYKPWKVILVLAEEEFPEKNLPHELIKQTDYGLEILWTAKNTRSFNKLLPTRELYPDAIIVTIDDDIFYEPWRLSQLVEASKQYPNAIIGHRGREVKVSGKGLDTYSSWTAAGPQTLSNRIFLTGVGGILYPPHILDETLLMDRDKALKLCPTADDVWFWAVELSSNIPRFCLGNHGNFEMSSQIATPALKNVNCAEGQNDVQIHNTLDALELWDTLMRN